MIQTAAIFFFFFQLMYLAGDIMTAQDEKMLFDFSDPAQAVPWMIVNDGVMGGISQSRLQLNADSSATFSGTLSLENNGGFASVRTRPQDYDLEGYAGIAIRVRGDGRTYSFRLRTDHNFDGIAYQAKFETVAGEWQETVLPFTDFQPTFRGRTLRNVAPLNPKDIRQIGFLIADKQPGRFELVIDWVKAY